MEYYQLKSETPKEKSITINGKIYKYSITKVKKEKEESLIIKFYESNQKSNIFFSYEAPISKLTKEVEFLSYCGTADEIIITLENIFSKGNSQVQFKNGEYYLNLYFNLSGIKAKSSIKLTKNEIKETYYHLENKIDKLENKFTDLNDKYEELKSMKENILKEKDVKRLVKEIFDNDIKNKLFEEMEQILLYKYNFKIIPKNNVNDIEIDAINKVQKAFDYKEKQLNNQINNHILEIQKQLKEYIDTLNDIKSKFNNNYIILQIKVDEKNLNKDIRLFNQKSTYKFFCNFERDDIEVIIDNQIVPVKFKNINGDFKKDQNVNYSEKLQMIDYNLNTTYEYYWNFSTIGIHFVKIIFKKKLLRCYQLFSHCKNISKIDCSNFDCSQIIDCSEMFYDCPSLVEIDLGKLDFCMSYFFNGMFRDCKNLEKLDVSNLNTQNSKSFNCMFSGCAKLKKINISNFKTKNCEDIYGMFICCKSLESIDMLKWDMKNINNIENLFLSCFNLKYIKMNFDNSKAPCSKDLSIFTGLTEGGKFVHKKGINHEKLLALLPENWSNSEE